MRKESRNLYSFLFSQKKGSYSDPVKRLRKAEILFALTPCTQEFEFYSTFYKGPSIYDIRFLDAIFDLPTHPSPIFT